MNKRGNLRASDQEREQFVDRLHKAHTEGRIGDDELEQRVSAALKARTYAELEATVADLPRADRRSPAHRRSMAGWALTTMRANPVLILVAIPLVAVATAMLVAATLVFLTLCLIFLVIGGRRSMHRGPWVYARHYHGPTRHRSYHVPGPRRGPGSDWI